MILDIEKVTEKFRLYSGEELDGAEPGRDGRCRELCGECAVEVMNRVKPEVLQEEDPEEAGTLESLAAAEAFYQLAALDQAAVPQAVSSAEIKLQLGDRLGAAGRLRRAKRAACAGLLYEDEFYFAVT